MSSINEMRITSYGGFDPGMRRMPTFVVHHYTKSAKSGLSFATEWEAVEAAGGSAEDVAAAKVNDDYRISEYEKMHGKCNIQAFAQHPFSNMGS